MRLTLHTDYALRVLMFVGIRGDALSTINEIAEQFDIPRGHLTKVVHRLGQKGYLCTVRGKNGGLRLACAPMRINVGAVVRDMEEGLGVMHCLQGIEGYCRVEGYCVLRSALREATAAFLGVLDRYTIRDLLGAPQPLARLLGIEWPLRTSGRDVCREKHTPHGREWPKIRPRP